MGWVLGPKFSKQGSPFRRIFLKTWAGLPEISKNLSKMGSFPPKFIIKVGMTIIDDCAKDGGEEFFTEMQCVL